MSKNSFTLRGTIVLVGIYLEGVYPRGDVSVEADLLAPALLKACVDSDLELAQRYEVVVLNLPTSLNCEKIVDLLILHSPVAVGFSVYMWNVDLIQRSAMLLRAISPKIKIFAGGPEVTYSSAEFLAKNQAFDFVICGSGEERLKAILKNDLKPDIEPQVSKITYRSDNGKIIQSQPDHAIADDLSTISSPYKAEVINLNDGKRHCVFIETYRGCIFKCSYCMWMGDSQSKKLNLFPLKQVLEDIEIIYNNPNVAAVYFIDACIFYTKERALAIIDAIAKCKYKIPTTMTLDIAFMDEDAVHAIKKLELSHQKFHFGMQSVNMETMRYINRKVGPQLFKKRIEMMREIDPELELSLDLIYGLPGDTFYTFRKTVDFALSLSPIKLNLSPLVLLPGSTFWMDKEKHGFVYEQDPPFLVHWNNTYSADDMRETSRFVLGVIMIMYFPAIRETIYKMTKNSADTIIEETLISNDFAKGDETEFKDRLLQSRVGLVEFFMGKFETKSGLNFDIKAISGTEQFSEKNFNHIRKSTMDTVAKPINGLYAYQVMLEIIKEAGRNDLTEDLEIGLRYYQLATQSSQESFNQFVQEIGERKCNHVKFSWVVSSETLNSNDAQAITKTSSGGIGILC